MHHLIVGDGRFSMLKVEEAQHANMLKQFFNDGVCRVAPIEPVRVLFYPSVKFRSKEQRTARVSQRYPIEAQVDSLVCLQRILDFVNEAQD
jgi:hypothetical protein